MELVSVSKGVEDIAAKKVDGKPLKEIFSWEGVSFWWRLKNMVVERWLRGLTRQTFFLGSTMRYYAGLEKDLLVKRFFSKLEKENPAILILSLVRNRKKYFEEVEAELGKRHVDFSMVLYHAPLPKPDELNNPGGYALEGFLDGSVVAEEKEVRKHFSGKTGIVAAELEQLGMKKESAWLFAANYTEKEIPEEFRLRKMAEEAFRQLRPKVLMLTSEMGKHSYPTIIAARKYGVITVGMAHGTGVANGYEYYHAEGNLSKTAEDSINFVQPDYFLTYGNIERKQILAFGNNYAPERIIAIGQPRADAMARFIKEADKKEIKIRYALPQDKRILLWATQTHATNATTEDYEREAEIVYSAVKEMPGWELVVKLHPGEDPNGPLYRKYNMKKGMSTRIIHNRIQRSTWELVYASDAVLHSVSTVGSEALALGRPVLLMGHPRGNYEQSYYTNMGFDLVVNSSEDLRRYLVTVTGSEYSGKFRELRRKFMAEAYMNFGHASERMVDFLMGLAKG